MYSNLTDSMSAKLTNSVYIECLSTCTMPELEPCHACIIIMIQLNDDNQQ